MNVSPVEPQSQPVARANLVCVQKRSFVRPYHQRVPSPQNGEGRQFVQASRGLSQGVPGGIKASPEGRTKPALETRQGSACRKQNRPGMPCCEPSGKSQPRLPSLGQRSSGSISHSALEVIEKLLSLAEKYAWIPEATSQSDQHQLVLRHAGIHGPQQSLVHFVKDPGPPRAIGYEHFRRLGRRSGASIRNEIQEGHVDFVSDGTHHGHPASGHAPDDPFVLERREVIGGTSPTTDNDHVDVCYPFELIEGRYNLRWRFGPLHGRRSEQKLCSSPAKRDFDNVMKGSAGCAGDNPDDPRVSGQWTFAFYGKQAFGEESRFEPFERFQQRSSAGRAGGIRHNLEPTPGGPKRCFPAQVDPGPVDQTGSRSQGRGAIHDAFQAGVFALIF